MRFLQRLQLLLAHQALLFRAAQRLGQFLLARAGGAQGLLALHPLLQLDLQTLPQVLVLLRRQVGLELLQLLRGRAQIVQVLLELKIVFH